MNIAPYPYNESDRINALHSYGILDTPPDSVLDNITQTAANVCGTPIALISLIDSERQWFKSRVGVAVAETSRDIAFCAHAIVEPDQLMEIEDASVDERFCANPLVTGEPMIRFYAGKTLVSPDGFALGTLCVIDDKPGKLTTEQKTSLGQLAQVVIDLLNERRVPDKSVNDDHFEIEQVTPLGALVTAANQSSANLQDIDCDSLEGIKKRNRKVLYGVQPSAVDALTCIASSAIEYDLHFEPIRLINFIDFYCTYLQHEGLQGARLQTTDLKGTGLQIEDKRGEPHEYKISDSSKEPVTFLQFIFDQTLLDETARVISTEVGERVDAPAALTKVTR